MNVNNDYCPTVFVNYTRERLDIVIISRINVRGLNLIETVELFFIRSRFPGTTNLYCNR